MAAPGTPLPDASGQCARTGTQQDSESPRVPQAAVRTFSAAAFEPSTGKGVDSSVDPAAANQRSPPRCCAGGARAFNDNLQPRMPLSQDARALAAVATVQPAETAAVAPTAAASTIRDPSRPEQGQSPRRGAQAIMEQRHEHERDETGNGSESTEERPRVPATSLGEQTPSHDRQHRHQHHCAAGARRSTDGVQAPTSSLEAGSGPPYLNPGGEQQAEEPAGIAAQTVEQGQPAEGFGLQLHPPGDQQAQRQVTTPPKAYFAGVPPTHPSNSDPDYEVPRGVLTETQVLKRLAHEQQSLQVDKYGFVLSAASLHPGSGVEQAGPDAADGVSSRRASGAAASTSGQPPAGRAANHSSKAPEPLRRWRSQHVAQQLQEQSVRRLRKWRKMLGPRGGSVVSYWRHHPAKFKRRVRKGIPEQLRGLAWFAISGGKMLMDVYPAGTFERLAADEPATASPVQPRSAGAPATPSVTPSTAPPTTPDAGSPSKGPAVVSSDLSGTSTSTAAAPALRPAPAPGDAPPPAAAAAPAHKRPVTGPESLSSAQVPGAADLEWDLEWMQTVQQGRDPVWQQEALDPAVRAAIMRDLNRTFPTNVYFMQRQGPGQRALYTVLRAYAVFEPGVGYVQGMGFLAAVLLLYMDAREAFWTLVALMHGPRRWSSRGLKWLYTPGMPGLQCCLYQFKRLLRDVIPRLAERMDREGVDPALYATHWFNTAFAYTLPFAHLLRVWDVLLAEGIKTLFRVGLAVLQYAEPRLARLPFEALVESLSAKNLPALLPEEPEELLRLALRIPVSQRLQELEAEWQAAQRTGQRQPEARDRGPWRAAQKRVERLLGSGHSSRPGRAGGVKKRGK